MALLIALLIVVILASASTALAWQQTLAIRRTEDMLASNQAWALALGGEAVAAQGLATSLQGVGNVNLTQPWAQPRQGLVGSDAAIAGSIIDLQGLFNLNDLAPAASASAIMRFRFQHLLTQAGADPGLVDAVADWTNPIPVATGSEAPAMRITWACSRRIAPAPRPSSAPAACAWCAVSRSRCTRRSRLS
ncbi:General secretion pathway protein K [mine drainage metagenome]|uniref:General secretion pathway protein K n=1 Tax=mine drainage metagenome TaxID=410659 RepID=T1DCW8_9ZZZZ